MWIINMEEVIDKITETVINPNILAAIFTVLGAAIGYFIRYFLDRKKELESENVQKKRDMYQKFIGFLYDLFKSSRKNNNEKIADDEFVNNMYEFFKTSTLYSSPETINALGDYMQYLYNNKGQKLNMKETMEHLGLVVKYMRKELGLSNRGLGKKGENVFRAIFRDFNDVMKK